MVTYIGRIRAAAVRGRKPLCDHCDVLDEVLIDLTGAKVAAVIMRRVREKLHGESEGKDRKSKGRLAPEIASLKETSANLRSGII